MSRETFSVEIMRSAKVTRTDVPLVVLVDADTIGVTPMMSTRALVTLHSSASSAMRLAANAFAPIEVEEAVSVN